MEGTDNEMQSQIEQATYAPRQVRAGGRAPVLCWAGGRSTVILVLAVLRQEQDGLAQQRQQLDDECGAIEVQIRCDTAALP